MWFRVRNRDPGSICVAHLALPNHLLLTDDGGVLGGSGGVWGRPGEGSPGGSSQGIEKGTPGERPGPFFSICSWTFMFFSMVFHVFCAIFMVSRRPGDPKSEPLNVRKPRGECIKNTVFLQHPKIYRFSLILRLEFYEN